MNKYLNIVKRGFTFILALLMVLCNQNLGFFLTANAASINVSPQVTSMSVSTGINSGTVGTNHQAASRWEYTMYDSKYGITTGHSHCADTLLVGPNRGWYTGYGNGTIVPGSGAFRYWAMNSETVDWHVATIAYRYLLAYGHVYSDSVNYTLSHSCAEEMMQGLGSEYRDFINRCLANANTTGLNNYNGIYYKNKSGFKPVTNNDMTIISTGNGLNNAQAGPDLSFEQIKSMAPDLEFKPSNSASVTGFLEGEDCFVSASTPYTIYKNQGTQNLKTIRIDTMGFPEDKVFVMYKDKSGKLQKTQVSTINLNGNINDLINYNQAFYFSMKADDVAEFMSNSNGSISKLIFTMKATTNPDTYKNTEYYYTYSNMYNVVQGRQRVIQAPYKIIDKNQIDKKVHNDISTGGKVSLSVGFVEVEKKINNSNVNNSIDKDIDNAMKDAGLSKIDGYKFALKKNGVTKYEGVTDANGIVKFMAVVPTSESWSYTLEETNYPGNQLPFDLKITTDCGKDQNGNGTSAENGQLQINVKSGVWTKVQATNNTKTVELGFKKYAEDKDYANLAGKFTLTGVTDAQYEGTPFYIPSKEITPIVFPAFDETLKMSVIKGLLPGTYKITENTPSKYVKVPSKEFHIDSTNNENTVITYDYLYKTLVDNTTLVDEYGNQHGFSNIIKRIQIPVQKIDSLTNTNTPASNALSQKDIVFEIYADETISGYICPEHEKANSETKKKCSKCEYWEKNDLVWTLKTNDTGFASTEDIENNLYATNAYSYYEEHTGQFSGTKGLPAGKYHVEEKYVPLGNGYLRAVKRNADGRPIDKNDRVIYDLDIYGNEITDSMAKENPYTAIGTYAENREEAIPLHFDASYFSKDLTEISTIRETVLVNNKPITTDLYLHKQMDDGDNTSDITAQGKGIIFKLTSILGDKEYKVVTDNEGNATFKNVIYGTYMLTEERSLAHYTCSNCGENDLNSSHYATEQEIADWKTDNNIDETEDVYGIVYLKCPHCSKIFRTQMVGNEGYALMEPREIIVNHDITDSYGINGYLSGMHISVDNKLYQTWLQIIKKDDETLQNVLVAGVGFKIKNLDTGKYVFQKVVYPEPTKIDTFYTSSKGFLVLPEKLKAGNYQLEEVSAPDGYIIFKDPIPFTLDADGLASNTGIVEDSYSGGHASVKEGAFIGVSAETDVQKGIIVTLNNVPQYGKINITKTGEGLVSSTMSPYEDTDIYTPVYGDIALEGVTYGIYASEEINTYDFQKNDENERKIHYEKDELIEKITTNSKGIATSDNLPIGKYYVRELKTVPGYVLDTKEYDTEIKYAGQNELVAIDGVLGLYNIRQKLALDLSKTMEKDEQYNVGNNNEFKDVNFGLFATQNIKNSVGDVVIPKDALIEVVNIKAENTPHLFTKDLPYYEIKDNTICGYYYVKELTTNNKYVINKTVFPVEFIYDLTNPEKTLETIHVNNGEAIENKIGHGDFEFSKTDLVSDEALPNTGIRILDAVGNTFFEGYTDANGQINITLPIGIYYYQEFNPPEGYVIDTNKYQFEVKEDGEVVKAVMSNKLISRDLHLLKVDAEDETKTLANAGFVIKNRDTGAEIFRGYTDINGALSIKGLSYGHYTIEEFDVPLGYVIDTTIVEFDVKNDNQNEPIRVKFYNKPVYGEIEIHKTDIATDEALPNTGIRITKQETGETVFEGYTNENGDLKITGLVDEKTITLKYGKYFYQEFDAPEGYIIDTNKYPFEITEDGQIIKAVMTNQLGTGSVDIAKTDIVTSKGLPNTGIRIKDSNGEIVREGKTDENGNIRFDELPYGKYTYQEFEAPEGYIIDTNEYPFEIKENGQIVKCKLENKLSEGSLEFKKESLVTDKALPDTKITITDENGKEVFSGRTDKYGELTITNLTYGKYFYQESDAPKGYIIDTNKYPFEIKENGEVIKAVMKNEIKKSTFELTKTDFVTSEALPDAGIRIRDELGNIVFQGYTDSTGKITLPDLPYGKYTYQEFDAPTGYQIDTTAYSFEITRNGEIVKAVMTNKQIPQTPFTGDNHTLMIFVGIGIIAIIGATSYVVIKKRKRK